MLTLRIIWLICVLLHGDLADFLLFLTLSRAVHKLSGREVEGVRFLFLVLFRICSHSIVTDDRFKQLWGDFHGLTRVFPSFYSGFVISFGHATGGQALYE